MTAPESFAIEEYKTLREEILLRVRLQSNAVVYSGSVYLLTLTFLARVRDTLDPGLWGAPLLLLITPFYMMYRVHSHAVAKIASYIEVCVEPALPGLHWTGEHIRSLPRHGNGAFTFLETLLSSRNVISLYFFVMALIAWIAPWMLAGHAPPVMALVAMGLLTAIMIGNWIALLRYRAYREKWLTVWRATHRGRAAPPGDAGGAD